MTFCTMPDCGQPAGTACTMSGCPGRKSIARAWAMPSHDTLSVPAMRDFARKHLMGLSETVDPFARNCRIAATRNDINPDTAAEFHMDALEFCALLHAEGRRFQGAIYDPPYSPRQVSECYKGIGRDCTTSDTQSTFWSKSRDALDAIIAPGGVVVSFGWNTNGMGLSRGYEIIDLMLVAHGGAHNDTICMAERKRPVEADLFANPRATFSPSPQRGQPVGAGLTPDARPRIYPINPHTPAHTGETA